MQSRRMTLSFQYKLHVVTLGGRVAGSFVPNLDPGLGIRCASWHPGGTFLAVGGWDSKVGFIPIGHSKLLRLNH